MSYILSVALVSITLNIASPSAESQPATKDVEAAPAQVIAGSPSDKILARVERARMVYETGMETLRSDVDRAIDIALKAAANKSDNGTTLNKVMAFNEVFMKTGQLPELPSKNSWIQRHARLTDAMNDAYLSAQADFSSDELFELAKTVAVDREQFNNAIDMNPWVVVFDVNTPGSDPTIQPSSSRTIVVDFDTDYRLHVRGKRSGDIGELNVQVPLPDGQFQSVSTRANADGVFDIFLTIGEEYIGGDAGAKWPVSWQPMAGGKKGNIILFATKGSIELTSVRIKAIVSGEPPRISVPAPVTKKSTTKSKQPTRKVDDLRGDWTGKQYFQRRNPRIVEATTRSQTKDRLEIKVKHGNSVWFWSFKVDGTSVTLLSVRAQNGSHGEISNITTKSGSVSDGKLSWRGSWDFKPSNNRTPGDVEPGAGIDLTLTY